MRASALLCKSTKNSLPAPHAVVVFCGPFSRLAPCCCKGTFTSVRELQQQHILSLRTTHLQVVHVDACSARCVALTPPPCCRGAFTFVRELQRQHPAIAVATAWHRLPFLVNTIGPSVEQIDAAYFVLEDMHAQVRMSHSHVAQIRSSFRQRLPSPGGHRRAVGWAD